MAEIEALQAHLADHYGFHAKFVFSFEDDVVLVRDARDRRWIARVFPSTRPRAAVEGDARILAWLERRGYPAERPVDADPVSVLGDEIVLVTQAVSAVPRAARRETIKNAGGIRGLGGMLGKLNTLGLDASDGDTDSVAEAVRRPGGAWHHLADGLPSAELAVAADWLERARERAGVRELSHFGALTDALEAVDDCSGLPEAFIHPDFVLANVVATPGPAMVLVDWAGAGRGPRLWSLAFLLWAEGAKDLRRVELAVTGYRRHIQPEPEELDRLGAVIGARALVFEIWRLHHAGRAVADAATATAERAQLVGAIAARARAAFTA